MDKRSLTGAVGNPKGMNGGKINLPEDVRYVKALLYLIRPGLGGPDPADWPVCDAKSGDTYSDRLAVLILNFQMKAKNLLGDSLDGEYVAGGRVMPGSKTLKLLERVAFDSAASIQRTFAQKEAPLLVLRDSRLDGCMPACRPGNYKEVSEKTPIGEAIHWVADKFYDYNNDETGTTYLMVSIMAHGQAGAIQFCKEWIQLWTVPYFQLWKNRVQSIDLHACDVVGASQGQNGYVLCSKLAFSSGAAVRAADATQYYFKGKDTKNKCVAPLHFKAWNGYVLTWSPAESKPGSEEGKLDDIDYQPED